MNERKKKTESCPDFKLYYIAVVKAKRKIKKPKNMIVE